MSHEHHHDSDGHTCHCEHHHHNSEEPVDLPENYLDAGWLEVCLNVRNISLSLEFYQKLGFVHVGGETEDGWAVLENDACRISLYQGHLEGNVLNFRGGDIQKIGDTLKERGLTLKSDVEMEPDGSLGCQIVDPDGNLIYFNTHPDELDDCCCDEDCDCDEESCECTPKHS